MSTMNANKITSDHHGMPRYILNYLCFFIVLYKYLYSTATVQVHICRSLSLSLPLVCKNVPVLCRKIPAQWVIGAVIAHYQLVSMSRTREDMSCGNFNQRKVLWNSTNATSKAVEHFFWNARGVQHPLRLYSSGSTKAGICFTWTTVWNAPKLKTAEKTNAFFANTARCLTVTNLDIYIICVYIICVYILCVCVCVCVCERICR